MSHGKYDTFAALLRVSMETFRDNEHAFVRDSLLKVKEPLIGLLLLFLAVRFACAET